MRRGSYRAEGLDLYWRFEEGGTGLLHFRWATDQDGDLHFHQIRDYDADADPHYPYPYFEFDLEWKRVN